MLSDIDDFVQNLSTDVIQNFTNLITVLLTEVKEGKRKNWRHDVFVGKHIILNGRRLMKHHLTQYSVDSGDFSEQALDTVRTCMTKYNSDMFTYNETVLIPTTLRWIVVALGEVNGAQAQYYLANGGKRKGEEAYRRLENKACK